MNKITTERVEKIALEFNFQKGELNFDKNIPLELKDAIYDGENFKKFLKKLNTKFKHETL